MFKSNNGNDDQKFIGDWAYMVVWEIPLRGVFPCSIFDYVWVILSLWIHSVIFLWGILT